MKADFSHLPFRPADILLPRECDLTRWSVVACDQYTSQPEYWQRVEEFVGRAPSSLRLILPESCLEGPDVETDIMEINNTMSRYLREGRFDTVPNALIYVERTLSSGQVRRGVVGMADLEQYDYESGADTPIRTTEGTVLSRIPPRVAVRKNAPIELPHAMLLVDDPERTVIEPLSGETEGMYKLYDFELMEGGGHLTGWKLNDGQCTRLVRALGALADPAAFRSRYGTEGKPLLFAVGDGNHSLATAKECYERQKRLTAPEHWPELPARYALVEVCNLHDESLLFEPIHRLLLGVEPEEVLGALSVRYPGTFEGRGEGHVLSYCSARGQGTLTIPHPAHQLAVGTLQAFLDDWLEEHPKARLDYIHGEEVARELAMERRDAMAFLLPALKKQMLFPSILHDGALPRKTFSIGKAQDKRFYLEARKIR